MEIAAKRYRIADMASIEGVPCPCGSSQRAFTSDEHRLASFHIVKIKQDSHLHFHKKTTEIYFVLEGSGRIEVDGESIAISAGFAILIKPGCRHRAVGDMTIINMVTPAFDAADEFVID